MTDTYTYRRGKKIQLKKKPNQFVIRQLPDALPAKIQTDDVLQVSTASTQVNCEQNQLEDLMSEGRKIAPTHHAYTRADTDVDFLITDRVIVTFNRDLSIEEFGHFAGKYGLEIVEKISERDYLLRLTDSTGMNPVKLVVLLTETEDIIANIDHDLNVIAHVSDIQIPTDPFYRRQWHLHQREIPSTQYDPRSSARCEEAWHLLNSFGSSDVVIGVIDDGCQLDHPDFDSPHKFAGWGYFQGKTEILITRETIGASSSNMYQPGANHGTACAGVIAAEIDGQLTVGVAPGCRLAPIKLHSEGPRLFINDNRLFKALDYLNDKVDVISNSWGSTPFTGWGYIVMRKIDAMVRSGGRRGKGVVFLWAAGNENCPLHHNTTLNVPFTSGWDNSGWVGVETSRAFSNELADHPGNMHVAALTSTAQRSHYSNYGTGISICAPSSNSHAYFRLQLPGNGIITAEGKNKVTGSFGGTSSATPLVAGIVGLILSANPELTALEVISILKQTASKDLNMAGWPKTLPAAFNQDISWDVSPIAPFDSGVFTNERQLPDGTWSPWFGHGKADAFAAVQQALALADNRTIRVHSSRTPNLPIPDRDPVGVSDQLVVSERGSIKDLKVTVDIGHSWIGDLVVRLVSPKGVRVILHHRAGNNTTNLVTIYDMTSTPQLSSLLGTEVAGVWALEVADLANGDVGTLNRWSIDTNILEDDAVRIESTPSLLIPDNDPTGVKDSITVPDPLTIADIAVEVDITHTWSGDLVVQLTGPNGSSVKLQEHIGTDQDHIQTVFSVDNVAELNQFLGKEAQGHWNLWVADLANRDTGKLNSWSLIIR